MKLFILFCMIGASLAQQATEDTANQARLDEEQIIAIATEDEANEEIAAVVTPDQKNDNLQPTFLEQPIANQPNQFVQAPQFVAPYPLYRNIYPAQPAFYQREIPTPIVHYVPVVYQPLRNDVVAAQNRQLAANFGANLGGLSQSGFVPGAAFGYGGPNNYYAKAFPSSQLQYSRAIPETFILPPQQIKPQATTNSIVLAIPQY